jgi:hypothetical protein
MIHIGEKIKIKNVSNVVNDNCPSFSGIVNQECKGELWVNDIEVPTIAIAKSYAVGDFTFLGTCEAKDDFLKLKDFLENELFIQIKQDGDSIFEFFNRE